MGLAEYRLRMEAYQLQRVQAQEDLALQAWFNQTVQATTGGKKPKPKFKKFADFFDTAYMVDQIREQFEEDYEPVSNRSRHESAAKLMAERIEEFRKLKERGEINV
ncbi:hypothetical protein QFK68_04925 [Limosilactobacillus fermentum]|nr:hypothetical protein [Limosilactobacillus fermentum]MDH5017585.1 hypothetical protein [Limosilactobacillus fermentum]